jgi:hypothetical protein
VKTTSWGRRATSSALTGLALLLPLVAACSRDAPATPSDAPPGASRVAPHLPVDFAFDSLDDHAVNAEATRGKPTVIAFVTTGSLSAQAQVDFLVAMARHDGDKVNYAVVALETRDNRELVELYRKALSIPFPVAMADPQTMAGQGPFGDLSAVPVTVTLDRRGRVVARVDGRVAKSEELRAALKGL